MKAVGCHVFAGGFSRGVRRVFDVAGQLERYDLGQETVESMGLRFARHNDSKAWLDERDLLEDAVFLFGNPKCAGCRRKQARDVIELCELGAQIGIPVIAWESAQHVYSSSRSRPFLTALAEDIFIPRRYRIAHVMVSARSFGNAQRRRRYFFVAYNADLKFNASPIKCIRKPTLRDVIEPLESNTCVAMPINRKSCVDYDAFSSLKLTSDEEACMHLLPQGADLNWLAATNPSALKRASLYYHSVWDLRTSNKPFGLNCLRRALYDAPCPTLSAGSMRMLHPTLDRTLSVGEFATLMNWDSIPVGPLPILQLVEGVVPVVGQWLAERAKECLSNTWGKEDWGISKDGERYDARGLDEKVLWVEDMT